MPLISIYDMILTPKGYRYPYTLPKGAPIWTFDGKKFVTVPFDFELARVDDPVSKWVEIRYDIPQKIRWKDPATGQTVVVAAGNSSAWAKAHKGASVFILGGKVITPSKKMKIGSTLMTVPYFDLVETRTDCEYLPKSQAKAAMKEMVDRHVASKQRECKREGVKWPYSKPIGFPTITEKRIIAKESEPLIRVNHGLIHNNLVLEG